MTKNIQTAVIVKDVTKTYKLRHAKPTLTDLFFYVPGKGDIFFALDGVNLKVRKGERVGIIGSNGSGKTTLLKIIAGITSPTKGEVFVSGKVVSLIDLSSGFHEDLSGSENIFLNGILIGMTRSEIEEKYSDIVSFSGIADFIDQPLYTYSDGMILRLGFSIAVHSNPDIFLLDEGFVVGDADFRKKCVAKIKEFSKNKKTVIIVSHLLGFLKKYTDRVVVLESSKIV